MLVFLSMSLFVFHVRDPFRNKPSSLKGYPVFISDLYLIIYTCFNISIAVYIFLTSVIRFKQTCFVSTRLDIT